MKLKSFLKLVYKIYKKCGDVDIEFYDSKGNEIELGSIGHFNFVMDVTMTFKNVKIERQTPECCCGCAELNTDNNGKDYCCYGLMLPTKKLSCKKRYEWPY